MCSCREAMLKSHGKPERWAGCGHGVYGRDYSAGSAVWYQMRTAHAQVAQAWASIADLFLHQGYCALCT